MNENKILPEIGVVWQSVEEETQVTPIKLVINEEEICINPGNAQEISKCKHCNDTKVKVYDVYNYETEKKRADILQCSYCT